MEAAGKACQVCDAVGAQSVFWAGDNVEDDGCIGGIVLASPARQPVGQHELGRNQAHGMARTTGTHAPNGGRRSRLLYR